MASREVVPLWLILAALLALGANALASAMTLVTVDLMRSLSDFAIAVRRRDLEILSYYQSAAYSSALLVIVWYVWPIVRHFRCDLDARATELVRRRTISAPLVVAGIGFLPWLVSPLFFVTVTIIQFGRWTPELASQQVLSPLVNGFLAATVSYLMLDWIFRAMVVPRVFPTGGLAEVPGTIALGVRGRLVVFLLAVAFAPLFTVLGLIRAAAAHVERGEPAGKMLAELIEASQTTFLVYVALGLGFTLLLAGTLTAPLVAAVAALRRIQGGALETRVPPTASDEVGVLGDGVNAMASALQEKERILKTFGRVVEPAVRDLLLSGELHLGGELRSATVLFSDLRGFTSLAEGMAPDEVVATLNAYFSIMAEWVRECGGFVDKYVGDAMLVVFGLFAPGEDGRAAAADAIRCALGMQQRLDTLNVSRQAAGQWPLAIGIGIHSGRVLAGTIGAEDRLEFTVIGDTVNVAERLQEVGKSLGAPLLVSETSFELAREHNDDPPPLTIIDTVAIRGRRATVTIYGIS
jgi:adenylate cyclase